MGTLLIILHVLTAVLFLGPVTVAVSSFQSRAVEAHNGNATAQGSALTLYKITQTYGMLSLLVPLIGFAVMFTNDSYWADGRFHASIALAVVAWAVLIFLIMPRQKNSLEPSGSLKPTNLKLEILKSQTGIRLKASSPCSAEFSPYYGSLSPS